MIDCTGTRITLAEVVLDTCSNTFGEGACTATGEQCYNNWNNCKRQGCDEFACGRSSYWFSNCAVPPHLVSSYTPNIINVESSPTTLELGVTFSTRGRIKITFQDSAHNDQGFDPYWPRGAIPIICAEDMRGTLFGRWMARVKYFENRQVNVYHGYADQPLCDFIKESYFIDSVSGPDSSSKVVFTLKDPLVLAEDKTAQCPRADIKMVATQAPGNEFPKAFVLGTDLDGVDEDPDDDIESQPYSKIGTYILINNYLAGNPAQDAFFAQVRHAFVDGEAMEVRAEFNNAAPRGWNVRLVDRGVCGSPIKPHNRGDILEFGETFRNEHVADVVCRLLVDCTEIQEIANVCCDGETATLIDFDSFEAYRCANPLNVVCEAIIPKPVGLTTLLSELSEQFLFFLYFDSSEGKIIMKGLAPPVCGADVPTIDECQIAEGSFSIRNTGERYNQITYYTTVIDCSQSPEKENLGAAVVTVTGDSLLEACERHEYKTRVNKEMLSRWINACNRFMAIANGERWLMLRNCPPEQVTIDVSFEVGKLVQMAGYAKIHHPRLQDMEGAPLDTYWLLKGKIVQGNITRLTFEQTGFDDTISACLTCDSDCPTMATIIQGCGPSDCIGVW